MSYSTYKKVIVYCKNINICNIYGNYILSNKNKYFDDIQICIDTSEEIINDNFISYEEFKNLDSNGIIFCAMKHREGSDIKNLDTCIFLDGVRERSELAFIQSIGRVLRKDKESKKQFD